MMIVLYVFLVSIYIISAYYNYKFFQKAYSNPVGKWADVNPEYVDLVAVLLPIVNTFLAMTFAFETPYTDEWEKRINKQKVEMKRKALYKVFKIHRNEDNLC